MNISERLSMLRTAMHQKKIDAYLITSSDFHQSEYIGEHFKTRAFMTGFTGSAGIAVITRKQAGLWTDGRYFIQAETELQGTGIELYKSGNPGVKSVEEFLEEFLPQNGTLGFDGRCISAAKVLELKKRLQHRGIRFEAQFDLVDSIWENRPSLSTELVYFLEEAYSGETLASKLARLRTEMRSHGATMHLLTSLEDIAWLFNIRGKDVLFTPVVLSYAVITLEEVHLFIDSNKLSESILNVFQDEHVKFHPYHVIYEFVEHLPENEVILLDTNKVNFSLYETIPSSTTQIHACNPTVLFKAIKNETEISNLKQAYLKDGIAHTKFLYWLKKNYHTNTLTEIGVSQKLEELRAEHVNFIGPSFAPISAYGTNAAMCHYSATAKSNATLKEGALFLADTGGHYLEGSTDITRTVALGEVSDTLKTQYTQVLRGNLALANIKFLHGCTGENLDILARQYLWNCGLDYKHGTGHGIGYLLSIHEGPCNIKWQYRNQPVALEAGMILSDEPGVYIEGSHGIRLENILLVCNDIQNEYGQFMHFETLTLVPFDLDAIDGTLLNEHEKILLNQYHQTVYDKIAPYLSEDEQAWLKQATRAI